MTFFLSEGGQNVTKTTHRTPLATNVPTFGTGGLKEKNVGSFVRLHSKKSNKNKLENFLWASQQNFDKSHSEIMEAIVNPKTTQGIIFS